MAACGQHTRWRSALEAGTREERLRAAGWRGGRAEAADGAHHRKLSRAPRLPARKGPSVCGRLLQSGFGLGRSPLAPRSAARTRFATWTAPPRESPDLPLVLMLAGRLCLAFALAWAPRSAALLLPLASQLQLRHAVGLAPQAPAAAIVPRGRRRVPACVAQEPVVSPFDGDGGSPPSAPPGGGPLPLTIENVELVLDEMRPYLMADGGNVEVDDIDGGVVRVVLTGACGSCPSSTMTLKMGLERGLREKIPEIVEVEQVAAEGPELDEDGIDAVLEDIRPFLKMAGMRIPAPSRAGRMAIALPLRGLRAHILRSFRNVSSDGRRHRRACLAAARRGPADCVPEDHRIGLHH